MVCLSPTAQICWPLPTLASCLALPCAVAGYTRRRNERRLSCQMNDKKAQRERGGGVRERAREREQAGESLATTRQWRASSHRRHCNLTTQEQDMGGGRGARGCDGLARGLHSRSSPGGTDTSWSTRGRRVTMPLPRGRKSRPTMFSSTLLLPLDWLPITTIWGRSMASPPTVLKTSWSLLITGISWSSDIFAPRARAVGATQAGKQLYVGSLAWVAELALSLRKLRQPTPASSRIRQAARVNRFCCATVRNIFCAWAVSSPLRSPFPHNDSGVQFTDANGSERAERLRKDCAWGKLFP